MTTQQIILDALKQGDKTAGELLDLTNCGSYPALNSALKALKEAKQIEYYFTPAPTVLMYKLVVQQPAALAWFRRDT